MPPNACPATDIMGGLRAGGNRFERESTAESIDLFMRVVNRKWYGLTFVAESISTTSEVIS